MKDKIKILSTVGLYHGFNDGAVVIIPILFPVFKSLFDLSYTQIGIITGGGLLITLLTQIIIGVYSDRKDRRLLLSIGILSISISLLLLTQVKGFITLLLLIFLLRFASGFFHPVGIGWISKTFKKERIDWAMGMQSAAGDFGAFIGILTTAFIVELKGWSYPFYLWSIIGILCLLIGITLTKNIDEKIKVNNNNNQTGSLLTRELEILKNIKLFIPGAIISGSAWGIVVSYLPLLLDERTTLSLTAIGVLISIWIGVGTIVCIFNGKITSIFGRKNVIISSYFLMGLMGFLLTFYTDISILVIIMILLGISTFLTFPSIFSYISEKTDEAFEGKVFGYILTVQLGGGTLILFLSGFTADIWGIWTPFFILGVISIFTALLLVLNHKKLIQLNS